MQLPYEYWSTKLGIDLSDTAKELSKSQQELLFNELRIYKTIKITSYIGNNLIIISYIIYIFMRFKRGNLFGFVFGYSWLFIFIILSTSPYLSINYNIGAVMLTLSILITLLFLALVIVHFMMIIDLHHKKRAVLLEKYHSNLNV